MLWSTVDQCGTPKQAMTTVETEKFLADVVHGACEPACRAAQVRSSAGQLVGAGSAAGPGQLVRAVSAAGYPEHLARLNLIGAHRVQLQDLLDDQPGVGVRSVPFR